LFFFKGLRGKLLSHVMALQNQKNYHNLILVPREVASNSVLLTELIKIRYSVRRKAKGESESVSRIMEGKKDLD